MPQRYSLSHFLLLLPSTLPLPLPLHPHSFAQLTFLFLPFPTFYMTFLDLTPLPLPPLLLLSSIPSSLHPSIPSSTPPSLHLHPSTPSPLLPSSGHLRTNLQASGGGTTDRTSDLNCEREIPQSGYSWLRDVLCRSDPSRGGPNVPVLPEILQPALQHVY